MEINMPPKWWSEEVFQCYFRRFTAPDEPIETEISDFDKYWESLSDKEKDEQYQTAIRFLVGQDIFSEQNRFSEEMKVWKKENPGSIPKILAKKQVTEEEIKNAPTRCTFKVKNVYEKNNDIRAACRK